MTDAQKRGWPTGTPKVLTVPLKPDEVSDELRPRIDALGLWDNVHELRDHGYTVIKDVAPPALMDELRAEIHRLSAQTPGALKGQGASFLLGRSAVVDRVATLPKILVIAEFSVGKGMRASQFTSSILTSESLDSTPPQHADQGWIPIPFPEHNLVLTFCVPCEGMTGDGGATRVVPGTKFLRRRPTPDDEPRMARENIPLEVEKGSVAVWDGSVWHGTGRRTIPGTRTVLHATYQRYYTQPLDDYSYLLKDEKYVKAASPELLGLLGAGLPFGTATADGGIDIPKLMRAANWLMRE